MVRIAPVGLQYNPKTLWFDAGELEIEPQKHVIVETARGLEYARLVSPIFEASEEDLSHLKSELKPVLREACDEDIKKAQKLDDLSREALPVFKELAAQTNEDMHPIMVEYLFEGDKAVFYFSADDRVDFRELVRKLAAHFHVRIDMRQIGVRDEARAVGGIGHCGQELCCKRLGGEFNPVSIRMAKEQDLSLNPAKISGVCGRLMCCLRYEYETYKECKCRCPKQGSCVCTPEGNACVTEINVPKEEITLKMEDGKQFKVALEDMEAKNPGERPSLISQEVYERAISTEVDAVSGASVLNLGTQNFVGTDKLADPSRVYRSEARSSAEGPLRTSGLGSSTAPSARNPQSSKSTREQDHRRPRRRKGDAAAPSLPESPSRAANRRPRRSHDVSATSRTSSSHHANEQQRSASTPARRPGHNSSGLRARRSITLNTDTRAQSHSSTQASEQRESSRPLKAASQLSPRKAGQGEKSRTNTPNRSHRRPRRRKDAE